MSEGRLQPQTITRPMPPAMGRPLTGLEGFGLGGLAAVMATTITNPAVGHVTPRFIESD